MLDTPAPPERVAGNDKHSCPGDPTPGHPQPQRPSRCSCFLFLNQVNTVPDLPSPNIHPKSDQGDQGNSLKEILVH